MPTPERLRELAEAPEPRAQLVEPFFLQPGPDVAEILLVRHAHVPGAATGGDESLTGLGREQAEALAEYLGETRVDAVYASPSNRARETAEPLARRKGLEVTVLDDLRDIDNRFPHGKSVREALALKVGEDEATRRFELMRNTGWSLDLFGGLLESSASLRSRTAAAIEGALAAHPGGRIVVATHAPPIAAYVAHVLGSPADFLFYPRLTSITVVMARGERRQLQLLNATPHFCAL
ncbi:MAG TPA: histidine phosphatase family protein [Dehalococcoidia bacterium]|nr:histidine phosphatase family protein [Dehalococcoidia bacterium]